MAAPTPPGRREWQRPTPKRLVTVLLPIIAALIIVAVLLLHFAGSANSNAGGNQATPGNAQPAPHGSP